MNNGILFRRIGILLAALVVGAALLALMTILHAHPVIASVSWNG